MVTIKDTADDWAGKNLSNFSLKALAKLMHDHVQNGGVINQQPETRPEWNDRDFHYDFHLSWAGHVLYVERVLVDDNPRNPYIDIVSIHDA
ncbi:MAG: hypothetical protein HYS12_05625 [Planctomycetes bacterium]|nr:hypothetical protein [Planctomycetota bacterium]